MTAALLALALAAGPACKLDQGVAWVELAMNANVRRHQVRAPGTYAVELPATRKGPPCEARLRECIALAEALAAPEVQAAFAQAEANPRLVFGLDGSAIDLPLFEIRRLPPAGAKGKGVALYLGVACTAPKVQRCEPIPPALERLRAALLALEAEQRRTLACARPAR